jgi:hypothetical protein
MGAEKEVPLFFKSWFTHMPGVQLIASTPGAATSMWSPLLEKSARLWAWAVAPRAV